MKTLAALLLALLLLLGSTVAVVGRLAWDGLNSPFRGYETTERIVVIEPGLSGRQIVDRLALEGVLERPLLIWAYVRFGLGDASLKAGEYRFSEPLSARQVIDMLLKADVLTHKVTILEGLTLEETAQHLADTGFGSLERFRQAMRSNDLISHLDPEAIDLEGYLFPDTYAFPSGTSEARIVETLVRQMKRTLEETITPLLEAGDSKSVRDLVILASIVEKEALVDEERPLIAGVYSNRLRRGMGLYADPTVIYALKRRGSWDGNIRKVDLQIDSPYNTYRHSGLPPGPIGSPGRASLEAAANPADVPYLYFVSRNDGTHVFSSTLAEHNRNVYIWQKKYWREQWARERQKPAQ